MAEVVKTIKACYLKGGMRIRYDRGACTVEGDVKCVEDYTGSLVAVTFERNGNEATHLIDRSTAVDVLRMPVPNEPKKFGAVVKRTDSRGGTGYFVRAKSDGSGYPWVGTSMNLEFSWAGLAGDKYYAIEILSEGVNIDD